MTLKDKAKDLVNTFYHSLPNNGSTEGLNSTTRRYAEAKQCALIAEDFAIYFAEWKDNNCFKATGIMLWYINMDEEVHGVYNNKQLLEIYKKMYEGTE